MPGGSSDAYTSSVAQGSSFNAYIEYDPYSDTYKISDKATYESSSLVYAIYEGIDYLKLKGVKMVEMPIKYSYTQDIQVGSILANAKFSLINATTFNKNLNFIKIGDEFSKDNPDYESLISDSYQNAYNYSLGFDLQYFYNDIALRFSANNINSPAFSTKGNTNDIVYNASYNLLASYLYFDRFISTISLDVAPTATLIDNYNTQYIYADTTWIVLDWLELNFNVKNNIANTKEGTVIGSNIGGSWKNFKLELYFQSSLNSTPLEVSSMSIPKYAKAGLNIVGRW